ncbi:MAG TPA: hypothetical protein VI815_03475, partial [Candidatus Nanoarchaeia archaeon]|nr:hypothetical protein [Candidatus Nanoarchaeia archaeon]
YVGDRVFVYRHMGRGVYYKQSGLLQEGDNENEDQFYLTNLKIDLEYDTVPCIGKVPIAHGDVISVQNGRNIKEYVFLEESD